MNFHDYFQYKDGELYWKIKPSIRTNIGIIAGTVNAQGYKATHIKSKKYLNHRIIFEMFNEYCPKFLDHIDGNRLNNTIENLRPATKLQNNWNRKIQKNNTSGVKGITWSKQYSKWHIQCRVNGSRIYLGRFNDIEEAKIVLQDFRSKNHGDFAKH